MGARPSALAELVEGVRAVGRDRVLAVAIVSATVFSLGYQGVASVGVPAFAKLTLHAGDQGLGCLLSAGGGGALAGTLLFAAASNARRQPLLGAATLVGIGVSLALVAAAPTLPLAATLYFRSNLIRGVCAVVYRSLVQERAAAETRGRVLALFNLGVVGLTPLSLAFGGVVADVLGPRGAMLAGGAAITLAGLYGLAQRDLRQVE
jgi:predicted MFS family arabinose efflux permease